MYDVSISASIVPVYSIIVTIAGAGGHKIFPGVRCRVGPGICQYPQIQFKSDLSPVLCAPGAPTLQEIMSANFVCARSVLHFSLLQSVVSGARIW